MSGEWLYNSIGKPQFRICNKCSSVYSIERGESEYNFCPCCGEYMLTERSKENEKRTEPATMGSI